MKTLQKFEIRTVRARRHEVKYSTPSTAGTDRVGGMKRVC